MGEEAGSGVGHDQGCFPTPENLLVFISLFVEQMSNEKWVGHGPREKQFQLNFASTDLCCSAGLEVNPGGIETNGKRLFLGNSSEISALLWVLPIQMDEKTRCHWWHSRAVEGSGNIGKIKLIS